MPTVALHTFCKQSGEDILGKLMRAHSVGECRILRSHLVKRRTLSQYQPAADGGVDICYQGTEEYVWYFQLQKRLFSAIMFGSPRVTTLGRQAQHFPLARWTSAVFRSWWRQSFVITRGGLLWNKWRRCKVHNLVLCCQCNKHWGASY